MLCDSPVYFLMCVADQKGAALCILTAGAAGMSCDPNHVKGKDGQGPFFGYDVVILLFSPSAVPLCVAEFFIRWRGGFKS